MLAAMRGLAIATVLAVTSIAIAEPEAPTARDAGALFQRARDLVKDGKYDEACPLFDQSYALDPALGTAINLADCLERQGQHRRAWELFDLVARSPRTVASRAQLARQRADALAAKLATVSVIVHERGLAITVGDRALPAGISRTIVEPGEIAVSAVRPGRAFHTTVEVPAGASVVIDVPAPDVPTRRRRSRLYLGGGLTVAGGAALGVSLGFAIAAKQLNDRTYDRGDCMHGDPPRCTPAGAAAIDRAGTRADLATGFAIGGAVLAVAGAVVMFTAPRDAIQVLPIAGEREIGLGAIVRF